MRQVGGPVPEAGVSKIDGLGMGRTNGAQECLPTTSNQFVLDGLGDEPAPVSFEPVDLSHHFCRQRDRDALDCRHEESMTQDMIILKL